MRNEIAHKINNWYHGHDREDGFIIADQILALVRSEIIEMENPYNKDPNAMMVYRGEYSVGFERCRTKALTMLEDKR